MKRTGSHNHVFRLIWSEVFGCWITVSEITRRRGKGARCKLTRLAATLAAATTALAVPLELAQAAPLGGQVTAGTGAIVQAGTTTTISQTSQNLSLSWKNFNVGAPETINFVQPSALAVAVNRIADTSASRILGNLTANGQVFLINPNGIVFGQGAQVNVGGLVASTLDTTDTMLKSATRSFSGTGTGSIVNQGTLTAANGGYIALLGQNVSNQGVMTAKLGSVVMGAGSAATLTFQGTGLASLTIDQSVLDTQVDNGGLMQADGGMVIMNAGARHALLASVVNNTGVIEARTLAEHDGTITLLGSMRAGVVNVGGTLDASAPNGGKGGFIETSAARVKVTDSAVITTLAPGGNPGTWLIDPTDYTIAASGGDITGTALSASLANGAVTIQSTNGGASGSGDVNVNDTVTWSANQLTLNAQNNININTAMNGSGTAQLALLFGQSAPASGNTRTYNVRAPVNLPAGPSFTTTQGSDGVPLGYTVLTSLGSAGSTTTTDLQGMAGNLNGNYVLGSNIDASGTAGWGGGTGFAAVGSAVAAAFTARFDGLGHTVTNLTMRQATDSVGLFGYTAASAVVQNVGLVGGSVTGYSNLVGALVGFNNGAILNSYATGTVSGLSNVGGLVGANVHGSIVNSYATGTVTGSSSGTGGLVGYSNGTVASSFATGHVTGSNYAGGLVGYNDGGAISNSYATGIVDNIYANVGGLVGVNLGAIDNSYATGTVRGTGYNAGGLVGWNNGGTISMSYATGAISGNSRTGGLVGSNGGSIDSSYATGAVSGSGKSVGGLVGFSHVSVSNSYATGNVSGTTSVGGLVGYTDGSINTSYATGNVNGAADNVGGLVGFSSGYLSNSYATGSVTGMGNAVGGLLGINNASIVINSYATGSVSGTGAVGGLIGQSNDGSIQNSYWNTTTSGATSSAGGVGLTTTQMQTAANFTNFNFTTTPQTTGNNWVMVDADGSLNNAGGASGATRPMLASEYSTSIRNAHQLQLMALAPAASYTLAASVNASAMATAADIWVNTPTRSGFIPIGNAVTPFTGTFNGQNRLISNLTLTSPTDNVGLFGQTGTAAVIQNVALSGGSVTANGSQVGALVGVNSGTIGNSYATTSVSGLTNVGGLVGKNVQGSINNSYATGSVNGTQYVGGLVGLNNASLGNSYATGTVTGTGNMGGLAGGGSGNSSSSYWNMQTSGQPTSQSGTGLTTAQMLRQASYAPGWDFANTWVLYEGHTSPLLRTFMTPLTVTSDSVYRTYDGTVYSSSLTSAAYSSPLNGSLLLSGTPSYGSAMNVGNYHLDLYSDQQGYAIDFVGSMSITPKLLTIVNQTAVSKVYDGSTTAALAGGTLSGLIGNETLAITGQTATFSERNASTGKTVTVTSTTLSSAGTGATAGLASNYSVQNPTGLTANITRAPLTLTAAADSKVYSGNTASAGVVTVTPLAGTDSVTGVGESFASKNVLGNNNSTLSVNSGFVINDGNNGQNYAVSTVNARGTITPAALVLSAAADSKMYTGDTTSTAAVVMTGLAGADSVSGAFALFGSKNVLGSNNSTLSVNSNYVVNDGNNGQNYAVTTVGAQGTITRAALVLAAAPDTKPYSGDTASSAAVVITGLATGTLPNTSADSVSGAIASFDSKNVLGVNGSMLHVNNGYVINDGNNGNNYSVSTQAASGTITQLAAVAWTGGNTGMWSLAGNWAGGAIPDRANVASVVIPAGKTVTFDAAVDALNGTVQVGSISGGNLTVSSGSLVVAHALAVGEYAQSGGTVLSDSLSTLSAFGQSAGTLNVRALAGITTTGTATLMGALTTGQVTVNAGGDVLLGNLLATGPVSVSGKVITVAAPVSWSTGLMRLTTQDAININAALTGTTASASLALNYGQSQIAAGNPFRNNINTGVTINLMSGPNFSTMVGSDGIMTAYTVIGSEASALSQLQAIKDTLTLNFALGANIDASTTNTWNSGAGFVPIGTAGGGYTGTFDGLGHTITNLVINRTGIANTGLFGLAGSGAIVQNVGLVGGSIAGGAGTGALIGKNSAATVANSYATLTVTGDAGSGGLVGANLTGSIRNSYATGSVNGGAGSGGLVGSNTSGTISNNYATGSVNGGAGSGGLMGSNTSGTISNNYATGSVNGGAGSGGLIGSNTSGAISGTYATGRVDGAAGSGGLIGSNTSGAISASYATGNVTGMAGTGGLVGGNTSGNISNSSATGTVAGAAGSGGLLGSNSSGIITNDYSTGTVTGAASTGGLLGSSTTGVVTTSYWNTTTSAMTTSAGGEGKTTAELSLLIPGMHVSAAP